MTPTRFRAALCDLGLTQTQFGKLMIQLGHPAKDVARSVRRWCDLDGPGAPGEVDVIVALLLRQAAEPPA